MPAYVAVQIDIHDNETYDRYRALAPASIAAHQGRYLVRGGACTTLEGSWRPSRFVILEFPSADHARRWWESVEYSEAKALRQSSAHTEMLLVEGIS